MLSEASRLQRSCDVRFVGLPRAGSTLVEQILASHPMIEGTMELPDMVAIAPDLRGPGRTLGEAPGALDPAALFPRSSSILPPDSTFLLSFRQNRRAVRTASSEQVRQPIFREGLDQWKAFEPFLGPLKAALGPVLDHYPAVPRDRDI